MLEKNNRKILFDISVLIVAIFIVAVMVLKVNWIFSLDGDTAPQTYALYSLVGQTLHEGEIPLWNPNIWGGISNIGSPITEAFYPINWILCYIFYNVDSGIVSYSIIIYNLIFHITIYFYGLYFLLKRIGVRPIWAAILPLLSICCFSFTDYFSWIVYFDGFCWFPFLVLASVRLIESKGKKVFWNIILLGLLFAMEASISVSLMLIITAFFIMCLFISNVILNKKKIITQLFKLVSAGILGIMLSMPVILSTVKFLVNGARYVDDETGWIFGFSKLPFESFVAHKISFADAESLLDVLPVRSWMSIGGVLLFLGIIGIFSKLKEKDYIHFWCLSGFIFCLFYCMGYVMPDFVYYVPFLNNLRETFMYGCVINFLITIFAGYGIRTIYNNKQKPINVSLNQSKLVIGLISVILLYNLLPHKIRSMSDFVLTLILVLVLFLLVSKREKLKKYTFKLLLAASFIYIYNFMIILNSGNLDGLQAINQINIVNNFNREQFTEAMEEEHTKMNQVGIDAYPTNQGTVLGIKEVTSYFNPASKVAVKSNSNMNFLKRSQLGNIKYWFINSGNDEEFLNWWDESHTNFEYTGKNILLYPSWTSKETAEVMVYECKRVYGGAWVVSNFEYYDNTNEEKIFEWINNDKTNLNKKVMINKDETSNEVISQLNTWDNGNPNYSINDIKYGNNYIHYEVNSDKEAILVTSEIYDSDWKVYVNGIKQDVLNVDYSNRAVIIPEGKSTVKFVYSPTTFVIGVISQILGVILTVFIGIYIYYFYNQKKDRL